MANYAIGLDNGGTVSKAALYDDTGREIAVASRQTAVLTPKPGYTERDMEVLWQANCECVREVLQTSGVDAANLRGIAVCGHGKGLYMWGEGDAPVYNGIVSTDNRAWRVVEEWKAAGVPEALYPKICQKLIPNQQAALLKWLRENERAVYDSIRYVFAVKDYIRYRLTGEAFAEYTDMSGSGLLNIIARDYDAEIYEAMGIPEVADKLPPLRAAADICGGVTPEAAAQTGLPEGLPVAGGMFDVDSCAIAMDVTEPKNMCTITGTWTINEFISKTPVLGTDIAMNSLYAMPEYYLIEECSPTSAGNLEWVLENLLKNEPVPAGKKLYAHVDDLVDSVPPGETDIYFLPFLYGTNAHPLAKGSFVGVTSFHNRAHLVRAVYEGVAYSARTHIEKLLSARDKPEVIRIGGGAANSALWVQMFADVLGIPVQRVQGVKELGAMGCAIAVFVGTGVYKDYPEATAAMVQVGPKVLPDADKTRMYNTKYQKYKAVRDALDTVWHLFET